MRIALCQVNTTVGDFDGNVKKVLQFLDKAKGAGCAIALFPELTLTGYPPRDLLDRPAFLKAAQGALEKVRAGAKGILAVVGTILPNPGPGKAYFNAAVTVKDGQVLHTQRKTLLPNYDVFDEERYFEPAPKPEPPFHYEGVNVAVTICEDIWNVAGALPRKLYAEDPVGELSRFKPDLVLNLSASPFHGHKLPVRQDLLRTLAARTGAPALYCNLVGGNDELVFDGCSMVMGADGKLLQVARDFDEDMLVYDTASPQSDLHPISATEVESTYKALVLGTRDYVTKCGFQQVLVGLSGGIDSALVACLAAEALGSSNVTGVTMPSPYSSPGSVEDSRQLAEALKINFQKIPIAPLFEQSLKSLEPAFSGMKAGVTEENLQARIRGLLLMALSNKFNRLVLSTGNKSELAVGYCTLYGDMCGGLAVLSDLPKTLVYELARHANRSRALIPEAIFTKPPSAELRPGQKDQDSLPPYETLDAILRLSIEENKTAEEIVKSGFDAALVRDILLKVDRNEYKRRQMAPGLKVTTKAFGLGRRVPIVQKFTES